MTEILRLIVDSVWNGLEISQFASHLYAVKQTVHCTYTTTLTMSSIFDFKKSAAHVIACLVVVINVLIVDG